MPKLHPYGPLGWLLTWETTDPSPIHEMAEQLDHSPIPHTQEITLGYNSLLIITKIPIKKSTVNNHLQTLQTSKINIPSHSHHVINVDYSGPDLTETATQLNIIPEELVRLHTTPTYTVRFLGFTPGFPYLDGLHPSLNIPRRESPRTRMNPGAVAIANGYTSIYTIPSPGGWHWIGNTNHTLFHPEKNNPSAFTLNPGDTINFISA